MLDHKGRGFSSPNLFRDMDRFNYPPGGQPPPGWPFGNPPGAVDPMQLQMNLMQQVNSLLLLLMQQMMAQQQQLQAQVQQAATTGQPISAGQLVAPPTRSLGAVRWAASQEGISEARRFDVVRAYTQGRAEPWSAHFISTCFEQSGGCPWGHLGTVQAIVNWGLMNEGHFLGADEARQQPGRIQAGDVAAWMQCGRYHLGLVTDVNPDSSFNTIEGNAGGMVARRYNNRMDSVLLTGFVRAHGTF